MLGGPGSDTLSSDRGRDVGHGGAGRDLIYLRSHDSTEAFGGSGRDELFQKVPLEGGLVSDGGPGDDYLNLRIPHAVGAVRHATFTVDQATGTTREIETDGSSYDGTIRAVEQYELHGPVDWVFHGDAEATGILARGRSLTAAMGGGDDTVAGTLLHDVLDGGPGDDLVSSTPGDDVCLNFEEGTC
jgi:Ca2+-binding RTX toxin-like protein